MYYNNKLVLNGDRETQTQLWILLLQDCNATSPKIDTINNIHMEYKTFAMAFKAALIKYLHEATLSPPKQTLLKAINNKQFST